MAATKPSAKPSKKPYLVTTEDWKRCTEAHEKICPKKKYHASSDQVDCVRKNLSKIPKLCQEKFKEGFGEVQKYKQEVAKTRKEKGLPEVASDSVNNNGQSSETPQPTQTVQTTDSLPKDKEITKTKKDISSETAKDEDDEKLSTGKKILILIILLGVGFLLFMKFKK